MNTVIQCKKWVTRLTFVWNSCIIVYIHGNLHDIFSLLCSFSNRFLKASISSLFSLQQCEELSEMMPLCSGLSSPPSLISSSLLSAAALWKCKPRLASEVLFVLLGLAGVLPMVCDASLMLAVWFLWVEGKVSWAGVVGCFEDWLLVAGLVFFILDVCELRSVLVTWLLVESKDCCAGGVWQVKGKNCGWGTKTHS